MAHIVTNYEALATSQLRKDALDIVEAGYLAIDTERVIQNAVSCEGSMLVVQGTRFDLTAIKRIFVIGFGKASCAAIAAIEKILRGKVSSGIAFDVHPGVCEIADVFEGSHPHPSEHNVAVTERIVELSKSAREGDLVIVVTSGGGSALLCYPLEECNQGMRLYEDLKKKGVTIEEMNTVRKHLSAVKGGGLAKLIYPATVIGLVLCDIPGEMFELVASGPTYFDRSTIADAERILERYGLTGYQLVETPKEEHYFERVHNFPVMSNLQALTGMGKKASELGYRVVSAGASLYLEAPALAEHLIAQRGKKIAVIAGGEPRLKVTTSGGTGGRCTYTALAALNRLIDGDVFVAFSSDGVDNSDAAGAIVDISVGEKARAKNLSPESALEHFDSYSFLKKTGDMLITGPLESNVSDLFVLLSH